MKIKHEVVMCPGGSKSQTAAAVNERYESVGIEPCKIVDVPKLLETENRPFVIPIWNSHEGQINPASYVWDHIQEAKIKIQDIWPKRIEFWFVRKLEHVDETGVIGSVGVAETQCSVFLKKLGFSLKKYPLTTDAMDAYVAGEKMIGVLVAPGQLLDDKYKVVEQETANPNNFTSFVTFVASRVEPTKEPHQATLTGVTMRAFGESLSETQLSFFENLLGDVKDISHVPRLTFVFKRNAKVGLLFEGAPFFAADLLSAEEIEEADIEIHEDAGFTDRLYVDDLLALCGGNFPGLINDDFIFHEGVNTCLFACPPLGIFIHGYEAAAVEPVFRFYISRIFHLLDEGVACNLNVKDFFERWKERWLDRKSDFFEFSVVKICH